MAVQTETISRTKLIRTIIVGASFLVVVVLLLIWLAGGFHRKIDRSPSQSVASASGQVESVGTMETVPVRIRCGIMGDGRVYRTVRGQ